MYGKDGPVSHRMVSQRRKEEEEEYESEYDEETDF
jgi:hypothetical protein